MTIPSFKPDRSRSTLVKAFLYALTAFVSLFSLGASARSEAFTRSLSNGPATRDGRRDFDFNVGTWHTHITRISDPFTAPDASITLDGTVTVRPIWGGRGQLEEIEANGPKGRWEGLTLFLYNPGTAQWNQTFIGSQAAELTAPLIGSFHDGIGELISQDTFQGASILVKGVWSAIQKDSHHFEELYSRDGGKTWWPAFIADLSRVAPGAASNLTPEPLSEPISSPSHGFDFDLGNWETRTSRLVHPLTGSKEWAELKGQTLVTKVWGGRANLAEYKAQGAGSDIELLSLRWYNPTTKQWNLVFSTPQAGMLGVPSVGRFEGNRGDFFDFESIQGKFVLVRFSIWRVSQDEAQSEQAFSEDGGKTWEVNWVNRYVRKG